MDGGPSVPAAFAAATSDSRVAILQALAEAHSAAPTDPWLSYSALQSAAGIDDNGNFNYHLDRLDGLVVDGPTGYRISRIGMSLIAAIASGAFDPDWTWGPVDAPGSCPVCGAAVDLAYADGLLRLRCRADGPASGAADGDAGVVASHTVPLSIPPSLLETGPAADRIARIAAANHAWAALTRRGICAECHGHVDGHLEQLTGHAYGDHYVYHGDCERCGAQHALPVGLYVAGHPAVVAVHHEHAIDVRSRPFWTLGFCAPGAETVRDTDPLRVAVSVAIDGADERLSLTLDRAGTVLETARLPAER